MQFLVWGRQKIDVGDEIPFYLVDVDHPNPLCRVGVPRAPARHYERTTYGKLTLEAARTVFDGVGVPLPFLDKRTRERRAESRLDPLVDRR